jgi:hypothetical protein
MAGRIARAALPPDPLCPNHVGEYRFHQTLVRNRFVGQSLEEVGKGRYHVNKSLDTEGRIHVNYSSY